LSASQRKSKTGLLGKFVIAILQRHDSTPNYLRHMSESGHTKPCRRRMLRPMALTLMFPHKSDAARRPGLETFMNPQQWQMKKDATASHSLPVSDEFNAGKSGQQSSNNRDCAMPAVAPRSFSDPRYRTCEWALSTVKSAVNLQPH